MIYSIRSREAFYINFDVQIMKDEKGNPYPVRGEMEFKLPKTIFELKYRGIHLTTPGKDDLYRSHLPAPIVQIPDNIDGSSVSIKIDLYFLEKKPKIWTTSKTIENLTIIVGEEQHLGDRFDELTNLKSVTIENIRNVPESIYKNKKIEHLNLIGDINRIPEALYQNETIEVLKLWGKFKIDGEKLSKMKSLRYVDIRASKVGEEESREIEEILESAGITAKVNSYYGFNMTDSEREAVAREVEEEFESKKRKRSMQNMGKIRRTGEEK